MASHSQDICVSVPQAVPTSQEDEDGAGTPAGMPQRHHTVVSQCKHINTTSAATTTRSTNFALYPAAIVLLHP